MNILASHWDLKLVALVLASALWIYTSGQVRTDYTYDVQVKSEQVRGLGENYQITAITPEQFRVTLSVPSNRWALLPTNGQLSPHLEVRADLPQHQESIPLTSAILGLPSDIRIVHTEPENLRTIDLKWEDIVEQDMPADRPPLVNLPHGLSAEVTLDVDHVLVRAARDLLETRNPRHVRFQPVDLSAEDPKAENRHVITVQLRPLPDQGFSVVNAPVASVELQPIPAARHLAPLPVRVLLPAALAAKLQVAIAPASVALTVRGPRNLLAALKPEDDLVPYIDLRSTGAEPATLELAVSVLGPTWLSWDTAIVKVMLTPSSQPEAPRLEAPAHAATAPAPPLLAPAPSAPPPATRATPGGIDGSHAATTAAVQAAP
jgi:hypothetical protein